MTQFFQDPVSWILVSFVIFVGLAFKFGRQSVLNKLDARIETIRKDIATAEALKTEAAALLVEYQRKQADALKEAGKLVDSAKEQALELQRHAEAEFTATMVRREAQMKDRLVRMEETAMDDIRRYAAELAVSATTQIIAEKMDAKTAQKLADSSIDKIRDLN